VQAGRPVAFSEDLQDPVGTLCGQDTRSHLALPCTRIQCPPDETRDANDTCWGSPWGQARRGTHKLMDGQQVLPVIQAVLVAHEASYFNVGKITPLVDAL
jgi:hypothetical protein